MRIHSDIWCASRVNAWSIIFWKIINGVINNLDVNCPYICTWFKNLSAIRSQKACINPQNPLQQVCTCCWSIHWMQSQCVGKPDSATRKSFLTRNWHLIHILLVLKLLECWDSHFDLHDSFSRKYLDWSLHLSFGICIIFVM